MRCMASLFGAFHSEKTAYTSMGASVLLLVLVLYDSP
jgi:hypothetical protein